MGIFIGTLALIIGLFFLIFPGVAAKIFRVGSGSGGGLAYHNLDTINSKGKWRFGLTPTAEHYVGKGKAKTIFRILGIVFIILSVIAYIYAPF